MTTERTVTTDQPQNPAEARGLRQLRLLVTVLTVVMIVGMLTVMVLLIGRLRGPATPPLPPVITLPDGTTPVAVTHGPDWYAVATATELLIFDLGGTLIQTVPIRPN